MQRHTRRRRGGGEIFLGKNHVKFGHFVIFSGKYHVKFWHFVNFSCMYFRANMSVPQSWLSSYAYVQHRVLATVRLSACLSVCLSVRLSVRSSVCPSVTRCHWVKTTHARITQSSPTDNPRTLVFGIKNSSRNSKVFTPGEGVKWEWGRKNLQFSINCLVQYMTKRCNIWPVTIND